MNDQQNDPQPKWALIAGSVTLGAAAMATVVGVLLLRRRRAQERLTAGLPRLTLRDKEAVCRMEGEGAPLNAAATSGLVT